MLSNHERRELARIEQGLRDDPDWREPRAVAGPAAWWRRWGMRLLIGFSGLVMLIGVITTDGGVLLEGVLMMSAAGGWWLCRQLVEAKAAERSKDQQPEH